MLQELIQHVPGVLQVLPTDSIKALLATNSQLRKHIQSTFRSLNVLRKPWVHTLTRGNYPGMRTLQIYNCFINADACKQLCTGKWPHLEDLIMCTNSIKVRAVGHLVKGKWPKLKKLDIGMHLLLPFCCSVLLPRTWSCTSCSTMLNWSLGSVHTNSVDLPGI